MKFFEGVEGGFIFVPGEATVENRVVDGFPGGEVLIHETDRGVRAKFGGDPAQDFAGAGDIFGHDEVTDEQTTPGDAFFVELQGADLAMHFAEGGLIVIDVAWHLGGTQGVFVIGIFSIGQIDIYHAIQEFEGFQVLVARTVIDERQAQPFATGDDEGSEDLGNEVGRCDEVKVMAAFLLQVEHHVGEAFRADTMTETTLAQREILAIGAACLTIPKKDGACSACATDGRLLATMDISGSDDGFGAGVTDASFACDAVAAAILGADGATAQNFPGRCSTLC